MKKKIGKLKYSTTKYAPEDYQQISQLVAIVHSMQGCRSKKTKMLLLYNGLKKAKYLAKYLRMTYDPNFSFGFTELDIEKASKSPDYSMWKKVPNIQDFPDFTILKHGRIRNTMKNAGPVLKAGRWIAFTKRYSKHFRPVLNGIVGGDLDIGLSVKGVNLVFKRLGIKPVETVKRKNAILRPKRRRRIVLGRKRRSDSRKDKRKSSKDRD